MEILTIKNLKKCFGDKEVLCGLDLSVPEHSVYGFIGRNGAGKTTTMKAILGLLAADEGEIFVNGEKVFYGNTPTNRFIGYLPDVPQFYSFVTCREYLTLCGESLGLPASEIKKRSDELLALVGLSEEAHRIKGFSRGMKQRLGIAQALLGNPKLLICDEPTSALDPIGRKEVLDILSSAREKTTVLFSTHVLSDVERICTDVAFLKDGRIAEVGSVASLKSKYYTEEFLIHTVFPEGASVLAAAFPNARRTAEDTVTFPGDDALLFSVLRQITEKEISVSKIERLEPSLESLFLEVSAK